MNKEQCSTATAEHGLPGKAKFLSHEKGWHQTHASGSCRPGKHRVLCFRDTGSIDACLRDPVAHTREELIAQDDQVSAPVWGSQKVIKTVLHDRQSVSASAAAVA